ncbi:MFS transporter [Erwinia sp. 9145]|uniref:MFS transporter n=1 Tax=Erwinia sp. 9145 TaxID=1500895 RepID=UPI00054F1C43|nr:MFS transporter [Erwinia sp. 9145]
MRASAALGVTGFSLIAVTYGMARFSWGLMLPEVAHDIPFSSRLAGVLTACSFAAYCVSIIAASLLAQRIGPRLPAIIAALCAAVGLLLLALSSSPLMLANGLFIAGLSAGLASPALADAVSLMIDIKRQPQVNTIINAGTSAGIIFSVPILLFMPGGWRAACLLFAVIALICVIPTLRYLPAGRPARGNEKVSWRATLLQKSIARLGTTAFISGMASAAWWSFGPDVLRQHINVNDTLTSALWLVSGGAGIVGALTGPVAARTGLIQIYRLSQLCMAAPLLLLALSHHFSWWLFPAVALCGAGYVTLSGVLLVCGASATANAPAAGVATAFFMLAAGQIAGSVIFGVIYDAAGAGAALMMFSALPLLMTFFPPGIGGHSR